MAVHCNACGGEATLVRARHLIPVPAGQLVADELPSVRCEACDRTDPAPHARPQLEAVIEIAEDLTQEGGAGPRIHKDFTSMPLEPDDTAS